MEHSGLKIEYERRKQMKKATLLFNAAIGILISVPLLVAKINCSRRTQETGTRTMSPAEVELEIKANTETVDTTEKSMEFIPYDFIPLSKGLQTSIYYSCKEYCLNYDLILAIIKQESAFCVDAIGDNGHAYGLMQVQDIWWDDAAMALGLAEWKTDPAENVQLGIYALNEFLEEYQGDLIQALNAYNNSSTYSDAIFANMAWIKEKKNGY